MMHRFTTVLTLAAATIVATACGSDIATEPVVTSVAGTFTLTTVDGKPLPYLYSASDPKLELISKQYVISASGTFTTSLTVRATELDGTVSTNTASDSGTETLANNIVTFVYKSDGSVVTARVSLTTLTIAGTVTQVFTKQ